MDYKKDFSSKDIFKRVKRQATQWRKILTAHMPTKGSHAEFIDNACQSIRKKIRQPERNTDRLEQEIHKIRYPDGQ